MMEMVCMPAAKTLAGMVKETEPPARGLAAVKEPATKSTTPVGMTPALEATVTVTASEEFAEMLD
jgi:hypothetical protein